MSDSAKVANSQPLDAAPPETDLRAMSDEEILSSQGGGSYVDGSCDEACVRRRLEVRAELLRRLARPDALREKVMAAIDQFFEGKLIPDTFTAKPIIYEHLNKQTKQGRDTLKAAVAAVLEGE